MPTHVGERDVGRTGYWTTSSEKVTGRSTDSYLGTSSGVFKVYNPFTGKDSIL